MKKTFLVKRNALLSGGGISWGAGAVFFVVFLFLLRFGAPNFFWQLSSPVFRFSNAVSTQSHAFFSKFSNAEKLTAETERLTRDNEMLANTNQTLLKKVSDIETLFGGVEAKNVTPSILAGVVARPPTSPYDTLVLAAGEDDGVRVGMEVFGTEGAPVGFISTVWKNFSRATLFSASGVFTDGSVGQKGTAVSINGVGGGVLEASVSRAAAITVGDIVYLPGPGQLPAGRVVQIDSDPLSPGVVLRIQPATNLFEMTWVTIRSTGVRSSFSEATSTHP